jgi:hypothetical protein
VSLNLNTGDPMKFIATGLLLLVLAGCASPRDDAEPAPAPTRPATAPTSEPTATPPPIVDSGHITMANGTAEPLPDGSVRYVVVEGDVGGVICDRFGLSWQQLQFEDGRGGDTCFSMVYPGEVVNLSSARDDVVPE